MQIELINVQGDEAELRIDGRTHFVPFIVNGSEISFAYDGEIWFAEVAEKGSRSRARHRDHSMSAPMPGVVLKILVNVGDEVTKGAPLLILEAMKMETSVTSPVAGKVAAIKVAHGETVQNGQVVVEFE